MHAFFGYKEKLETYEKRFQQKYGSMFDFLEFLEKASYTSNKRREWFTDMCRVRTVQRLTFDSYLFKDMATVKPNDHLSLAYEGVISAVLQLVAGAEDADRERTAAHHREGSTLGDAVGDPRRRAGGRSGRLSRANDGVALAVF